MSSFLTWASGVIGDGLFGVSGGNSFVLIALSLLFTAFILWRLQVSMPFALMTIFFVIGIMAKILNNPFDQILGLGSVGITEMVYGLIVVGTALLAWHLFFKKSQAGVG